MNPKLAPDKRTFPNSSSLVAAKGKRHKATKRKREKKQERNVRNDMQMTKPEIWPQKSEVGLMFAILSPLWASKSHCCCCFERASLWLVGGEASNL